MNLGRSAALAAAVVFGTLTAGAASATTPPADTTTTTTAAAPTTTVAPGVASGPTPPRGGSATGGLVHATGETEWDLRRIALSSALGLLALAVAGHLYGRMQSTTPRVGRTIDDADAAR